MRLIANELNKQYLRNLIREASVPQLQSIVLAVAYVTELDDVFLVAEKKKVPLSVYAKLDDSFPKLELMKRFVSSACPPSWRLFLTGNYYHPKIVWLQGVGAYIGSANLTDGGLQQNIECGVWFSEAELVRESYDTALASIIGSIRSRCVAASTEHVKARERLLETRKHLLDQAAAAYQKKVSAELAALPGTTSLLMRSDENAARSNFVRRWHDTLGILRAFSDRVRDFPRWPAWVDRSVHPAIAQDRASEWWYERNVRRIGDRDQRIEELYDRNRRDAGAAMDKLLDEWSQSKADELGQGFLASVHEGPELLAQSLSRSGLDELNEDELTRILFHTHAAREHIKQIPRHELGFEEDATEINTLVRCQRVAQNLLAARTTEHRGIADVLRLVLWNDHVEPDAAIRVWNATQDPRWKLPRIGVSILGEMLGYARPDKFPPRNDRAVRAMRALGHDIEIR